MIIGVTGFRRCGKNSTTSILERLYGFKVYAFADALREIAAAVNPVISLEGTPTALLQKILLRGSASGVLEWRYTELLEHIGYERAKDIPDFRHFLQRLGTEGIRGVFGPTAWVDALARRVALAHNDRVAISDVRFQSEADWVHSQGGLLWRVVRPGVGGDDPHPSEIEIPHLPADREIIASSLDELERAVINAAEIDLKPNTPSLPGTPNDSARPPESESGHSDPGHHSHSHPVFTGRDSSGPGIGTEGSPSAG